LSHEELSSDDIFIAAPEKRLTSHRALSLPNAPWGVVQSAYWISNEFPRSPVAALLFNLSPQDSLEALHRTANGPAEICARLLYDDLPRRNELSCKKTDFCRAICVAILLI
jgi:hypothetical protein